MAKLTAAFQTFFRENSEHWKDRFAYPETWPQLQAFLQNMTDELRTVPSWRSHILGGDRRGTWSLVVTRRITFQVEEDGDIVDLVDYH